MEAQPLKDSPISANLTINFNWECNLECNVPARTIRDTVLITVEENDEHRDEDMDEIIDVNRTASFIQPSHCYDKPSLSFTVSEVENFYISGLYIVCDCKIIEVFGDHDMYLDSIHGNVVEEMDSFRACEYRVDLSSKVHKKITVNFLKLLNSVQNHLWIYGINLTLKPMSKQNINSSIRMDNVRELLKDAKISDKASKCFKFVRESMINQPMNSERMPATSTSTFSQLERPNPDKLIAELKLYIDHKFLVLNEFLILRERNLHDKIDLILDYIKSQNRRN